MPRIRCRYFDCVFLDDGYCSSIKVEIDPDMGCLTFQRASDPEEDWDAEREENENWDGMEVEEDNDLWLDDDDY